MWEHRADPCWLAEASTHSHTHNQWFFGEIGVLVILNDSILRELIYLVLYNTVFGKPAVKWLWAVHDVT